MNADVLSVSGFLIPMPENHDLTRLKSRYETETKRYRLSIKAADTRNKTANSPCLTIYGTSAIGNRSAIEVCLCCADRA